MSRKQYIVMWTAKPCCLASTREDFNRVVANKNPESVVIVRSGYQNVVAGNILQIPGGGAITFNGITDWFRAMGWLRGRQLLKEYIPFEVTFDSSTRTLYYRFIGR